MSCEHCPVETMLDVAAELIEEYADAHLALDDARVSVRIMRRAHELVAGRHPCPGPATGMGGELGCPLTEIVLNAGRNAVMPPKTAVNAESAAKTGQFL
jgi:hypothetical protein